MRYSIIILVLLALVSCNKSFHIKRNTQVSELSIKLEINTQFDTKDNQKLNLAFQHTISQWNLERHLFTITASKSDSADLIIKVDSVFVPSKLLQALALTYNIAAWTTGIYGVTELKNPYYVILPIFTFQPSNITQIRYKLNNYTDRTEVAGTNFITKTRLFRNKEKERNRQIRDFDAQLFDFLESIEKEYRKKNTKR
ncbi:MAG: hypothetical protein ACK44D_10865 [Bacteroidia bacterium]